jgi:SAM-dependent methyltransferase
MCCPRDAAAEFVRPTTRHRVLLDKVRWMIDVASMNDQMTFSGWALSRTPASAVFLVDGIEVDSVAYPLPSPDVAAAFPGLPEAEACRFHCTHGGRMPPGHVAELEFQPTGRPTPASSATRWWIPSPSGNIPTPPAAHRRRVVQGDDVVRYTIGGATLRGRLDAIAQRFAGRGLASFDRILDWGCGSGRLTRALLATAPPTQEVWGADIDEVNIVWCAHHLAGGRFRHLALNPPTPFSDGSFDLVIGVSVVTHLREADQDRWLAELARITNRGGLVLLSIQGPAVRALAGLPASMEQLVERRGLVITGENQQISVRGECGAYYVDTFHSHAYVRDHWSHHFEVLDILEGAGLHQDVVVLRRR